jgi:putative Mg2+ transporter-C (MgtC) family protein
MVRHCRAAPCELRHKHFLGCSRLGAYPRGALAKPMRGTIEPDGAAPLAEPRAETAFVPRLAALGDEGMGHADRRVRPGGEGPPEPVNDVKLGDRAGLFSVIFKEGLNVRGLNTAATLWCSAAVGLLAGEGLAPLGFAAAILVVGANTALRPIVRAINRQPVELSEEEQHYPIAIECRAARAPEIRAELVRNVAGVPDLRFTEVDSAFIGDTGHVDLTATVASHNRRELALEATVGHFAEIEGVIRASWRLNPAAS